LENLERLGGLLLIVKIGSDSILKYSPHAPYDGIKLEIRVKPLSIIQ